MTSRKSHSTVYCNNKRERHPVEVSLLRLRLSEQEQTHYTNIFYEHAQSDKVSRSSFPKLLGSLGTDIAQNFADCIFNAFSSDGSDITLSEYLKYIDIYHYGDDEERCTVTMKLMDMDGNGQITYNAFKKYIKLILSAIKKVNPGLSEEEALSENDMKNLFNRISNNVETFKLDDFRKVYKEKVRFPEISWMDYFKSNDDSLVLIHNNIKDLLRIFKDFCEKAIDILQKISGGEWSFLNEIEDLTNKFCKFSGEIEEKKEKFLRNINRLNIKDLLFKPLNEQQIESDFRRSQTTFAQIQQQHVNNKDEHCNGNVNNDDDEHTQTHVDVSPLHDEATHKEEPQLINNSNTNVNNKNTLTSLNDNVNNNVMIEKAKDEGSYSQNNKSYGSIQNQNLRQSQMSFINGGNHVSRSLAKTKELKVFRKEQISTFFNFVKDKINKSLFDANNNNNNNDNDNANNNTSHYSNMEPVTSEIISSYSNSSNYLNTNEANIPDEYITVNKVMQFPLFQGLNMLNANLINKPRMLSSQNNTMNMNKNINASHNKTIMNSNINNPNININNNSNNNNNNMNCTNANKNSINVNIITFTNLFHSLELFLLSSYNSMTLLDESYEWIRDKYLNREFSKIEKAQKDKKKITNFRKENIPKKNAIKSTEENFNILLNMIIGINNAIRSTPNEKIELTDPQQDLSNYFVSSNYSVQITNFGSKQQASYSLKQYAGIIFNNIRLRFGFDKEKFISSISPQNFITEIMISARTIFEELCSSGKSGSLFYYTRDGKFILKTISHEEYAFLKKILPNYFRYVCENPDTLLPKFLGCYKLIKKMKKNKKKEKICFIIMMNIFCTDRQIHKRYDLKGSKRGRQVIKTPLEAKIKSGDYALKDKDLDRDGQKANVGYKRDMFMNQLTKDANFLKENSSIDYSLLFGLHNVNDTVIANTHAHGMHFSKTLKANNNKTAMMKQISGDVNNNNNNNMNVNVNASGKCILSHSLTLHNQNVNVIDKKMMGSQVKGVVVDGKENSQRFNPLSTLSDVQTERAGVNGLQDLEDGGMWSADRNNIYYFGIIDILTEYNCRKKAEYLVKLVSKCSNDMSCVPPDFYRDRFINYINTIIINDNNALDKT